MPPERGNRSSNFTFDRTAGSHSLAASGQRDRYLPLPEMGTKENTMKSTTEMTKVPRRFAWGGVVLGLALSLASYAAPALAQAPFVITSPPAGSILSPGQAVTVLWTGGDPSWSVDVYLIEVTPGFPFAVVAAVAGSIPNSGMVNWTFPSSLPFGGPCGHTYQFYVQEVTQITWTYGPHFTVVCEIPVAIDIKPGSFPNSINPRSRGSIPVAILTTNTLDATTVDPTTVRFGRTGTEAAPVQFALEDVDGDGDTDMILHFNTQDTGIVCGDTSASLTGETFGGQAIQGTDSIKTVGCK